MKRITILTALFIALVGLTFTGCPSPAGETVSAMPILAGGSSIVASKNITTPFPGTDEGMLEYTYTLQGPVLSGWETGTFEVGKEYTSTVNGVVVKTVATLDDSGNTTYTGTFDDNKGNFVLTLKTDNTWDYHQSIVSDITLTGDNATASGQPEGTRFLTMLTKSKISGIREGINLTGTNGKSFNYQSYATGLVDGSGNPVGGECRTFQSFDFSLKIRGNGAFVGQLVTGGFSVNSPYATPNATIAALPEPTYANADITAYEATIVTSAVPHSVIYRTITNSVASWASVNNADDVDRDGNPDNPTIADDLWTLHP